MSKEQSHRAGGIARIAALVSVALWWVARGRGSATGTPAVAGVPAGRNVPAFAPSTATLGPDLRRPHGSTAKGPSAPWFGGIAAGAAVLSFVWWLLWMWGVAFDSIGNWNYLIFLGLIATAAVTMRWWRGA